MSITQPRVTFCALSLSVVLSAVVSGCSGNSNAGPATGSGGHASGGATGSGGSASGGATGSGGSASGGATGSGGTVVSDASADGSGMPDMGGGDTAGGRNCAGNAVSLSANGTGMASDAAQARVLIDLMADLPIRNASRTVEFWAYIKPTDWVAERNQLYYYGTAGTETTFGMDFGSFAVTGMADNHATLDPFTNGTLSDDSRNYLGISSAATQWVHIAMSWDTTALKVYVNGALRITKAGGGTMLATGNGPLSLGCNPGNGFCFNGLFDELRVWNVARTEAAIMADHTKPLTGNEAGLVGYWKFDEAPGSASAADAVTTAGHTAHPGMPTAVNAADRPTFVTPNPPAPIVCP